MGIIDKESAINLALGVSTTNPSDEEERFAYAIRRYRRQVKRVGASSGYLSSLLMI